MKSDLDALMKDRNMDAILVLGDAEYNPPMYYFVGGGHVSAAILLKKRGEEPVLFFHDMERDEAAKSGLQTRSFSEFDWQDLLKQANGDMLDAEVLRMQKILTEYGLTSGRIAIYGKVEFSQMFAVMMKLAKFMPDLELVGESDIDSMVLRAMETK